MFTGRLGSKNQPDLLSHQMHLKPFCWNPQTAAALLWYRLKSCSWQTTEGTKRKANAKYFCGIWGVCLNMFAFKINSGVFQGLAQTERPPLTLGPTMRRQSCGSSSSGLSIYFSSFVRLKMNENSVKESSLSFSDGQMLSWEVILSNVLM